MYKDYFHFSHYPFHNTPNPDFYFNGPSHREALATMVYGVQEGKGFVLVIGDVGTGKTMLVQALKRELGERYMPVEISHPWISPEDVLSILCAAIGLSTAERESPGVMDLLRRRLLDLDAEGRQVVLVIDEAHQLPERTLEGIRLLSNIETPVRKLVQIILLGQEELSAILGQYSMRQLQQRIGLSYHLLPLGEQETEDYIHHRLRVAGGNPGLFPPEIIAQIFRASAGSPRIINQLCDNCLLIAYGRGAVAVDADIVREALGRMVKPLIPKIAEQWSAAEAAGLPEPPNAVVDEPPPFELPMPPAATRRATDPQAMGERADPRGRNLVLYGVLAGLLVGAGGLWLSQDYLTDTRRARPVAESQRPGPAPEDPRAPVASPAPAAMAAALPFPYSVERVAQAPVVTVSEKDGVILLASSHYGAWNDTVQDILHAANPEIVDLERAAPGTVVRMPRVSRQGMVVTDDRGVIYVYYASFLNEDAALASLQLLKQTWNNAFVSVALRHGVPVHRIYVGGFDNRRDADTAIGALWFKYLPTVN